MKNFGLSHHVQLITSNNDNTARKIMLALRNMPLVVDLNDLGEATSQVRSYEWVSHLLVLTMAFPRHTQVTDHAQAVRSSQYLHFLTTDQHNSSLLLKKDHPF